MYSNTSSLSLCLVHSNCNSASVTVAIGYVSFSGTFLAFHRCLSSAMGSFRVPFSKIFVFFYALPRFCAYFAFLLENPVYSISCFPVLVLFLPQWLAPFLLAVSVFCLAEGSQSQNLWDSGALRPYLFNSHSCFWCAGYSDLLLSDLFSGSSLIGPLLFSLLSHQNKGLHASILSLALFPLLEYSACHLVATCHFSTQDCHQMHPGRGRAKLLFVWNGDAQGIINSQDDSNEVLIQGMFCNCQALCVSPRLPPNAPR